MSGAVSNAIFTVRREIEPSFHPVILAIDATTDEISGRCEPPNDSKGE
jgi:hypothetical protein